MCGVFGVWGPQADEENALAAINQMRSRGPDGQGVWFDDVSSIILGHRRLSIIDVSQAGAQPMASVCGRYWLTYNGEIYNHQDVRTRLENECNCCWLGRSDSETLLAALANWGVERTLEAVKGMFAFALWDRQERKLLITRDRAGEKPLYYGFFAQSLIFASQLAPIMSYRGFDKCVDRQVVYNFLARSNIPAPESVFKNVFKLPPGTYMEFLTPSREGATLQRYWRYGAAENTYSTTFWSNSDAVLEEADRLLTSAVASQMGSDVPLGSFLSGGYDSSLITSKMADLSSRQVRTFTIGFDDNAYDEAQSAKRVADYFGTDHTELRVQESDLLAVVPSLCEIYDEPFADASQIPTYMLAKLTKSSVTVCLSGDGGDELFGGYNRYNEGFILWKRIQALPPFLRSKIKPLINNLTSESYSRLLGSLIRAGFGSTFQPEVLSKVARLSNASDVAEYYLTLLCQPRVAEILSESMVFGSRAVGGSTGRDSTNELNQMMQWDFSSYLPDGVLTKVDRATMASSLESRAPLLDWDLIDFSANMPINYKIGPKGGKLLLRRLLQRSAPADLVKPGKRGFTPPLALWLRTSLKVWSEDLLSESSLNRSGIFDAPALWRMWSEFLAGDNSCTQLLWNVLMFQSWHLRWIK